MKLMKPYFVIEDEIDGQKILKNLEKYGRTCYKSEAKITSESAAQFIRNILKSGHESIIEHEKITVRMICDRGVTHEIVRHRLASYSQESTRYCNYGSGKFEREITVIKPPFFNSDTERKKITIPTISSGILSERPQIIYCKEEELNEFDVWFMAMIFSEWAYMTLTAIFNRPPEQARSVLPNSLKTEIIMTYNLREWRHFFKLRTSKRAHPQMREIAIQLLKEFQKKIPIIFDDIQVEDPK